MSEVAAYKEQPSGQAPDAAEAKKAARWQRELTLAGKREKDWRDEGEKIVKRYSGEEKKRNRYNVLWSNTDVLRPAIYNSKPQPDVRRRFRDNDPIGKAVGEVLERCLYVMVDGDSTDLAISNDVLDALLPGRGVSRIRYIPQLAPTGDSDPAEDPADDRDAEDESATDSSLPAENEDESLEQVEYEQVIIEHVDWKDFRHGFGRVWSEVPWVGFRHKLSRKDAEEKFGADEVADIKFAIQNDPDREGKNHEQQETTKLAEFWEIWDKENQEVFFLCDQVERLFYPLDNPDGEPPLDFEGFFPCPEPLRLVETTGTLLPTPLFHLYEDQANQLDKLSMRIDKIIGAMKLRGVYDSKLSEIPDLLTGDDNQLVPVQNAQQWADAGGLEKAIAWMPVEQAEKVLMALYEARTRQKAIIDELTGIADIVRGATDPDETLGAQQLKSNYYSVRLWRMQACVKRYARDLLRLASQVICTRFGQDTLAAMTDLKFPTAQQKQAAQAQAQLMAQAAQQQGQPPPPPPAMVQVPTWEDIQAMLRSPGMRQFRVDVETDSTIAGTLQSDMAGLSEVLKAVQETVMGLAPIVSEGALPPDAAKELVLAVIRRARLGTAVEDAFDKMQAPKPKPNPEQAKHEAAMQQVQAKAQADIQIAQIKAQLDAQVAQAQQQAQAQQNAQEQMMEQQRQQQKAALDEFQTKLDAMVKIVTATITATQKPDPQVQPTADATVRAA